MTLVLNFTTPQLYAPAPFAAKAALENNAAGKSPWALSSPIDDATAELPTFPAPSTSLAFREELATMVDTSLARTAVPDVTQVPLSAQWPSWVKSDMENQHDCSKIITAPSAGTQPGASDRSDVETPTQPPIDNSQARSTNLTALFWSAQAQVENASAGDDAWLAVSGRVTDILEIAPPQIMAAILGGLDRFDHGNALSIITPTAVAPAFTQALLNNIPLPPFAIGKYKQEYYVKGYRPASIVDWQVWLPRAVAEHARQGGWPLLDERPWDLTYGAPLHVAEGVLIVDSSPIHAGNTFQWLSKNMDSDLATHTDWKHRSVQHIFPAVSNTAQAGGKPWNNQPPRHKNTSVSPFHIPDAPCLFVPDY
jgi:hypothetical protein